MTDMTDRRDKRAEPSVVARRLREAAERVRVERDPLVKIRGADVPTVQQQRDLERKLNRRGFERREALNARARKIRNDLKDTRGGTR